jgi:putative transposase
MTISRKQQISLDETSYYHCISRCVRRAFLCGEDKLTGDSYEHRRSWIVEKLKQLDGVIERWQKLFKGSVLVDRYRSGQNLSRAEWDALGQLVSKWRERLSDISWFKGLSRHLC